MKVEVRRYLKDDGWPTRHWAVYVDGELLAVVLYRKGAVAIRQLFVSEKIRTVNDDEFPPEDNLKN